MPGLLRGVVRTAAVAGTATAVSNRVSRRQAERWQRKESAAYGQPEPTRSRHPNTRLRPHQIPSSSSRTSRTSKHRAS